MSVVIRREDSQSLVDYAGISTAYEVCEAIHPLVAGAPGLPLPRTPVSPAFRKDYDVVAGNHPRDWAAQFSVDDARFLGAYSNGRRVGSAVVVVESSDAIRLGGKRGYALLWDLRVTPAARGQGIGRALLRAAETEAAEAEAAGIVVETQSINVAACELYARAGYAITKVDANAYHELPTEVQVMWTKTFEVSLASG